MQRVKNTSFVLKLHPGDVIVPWVFHGSSFTFS